MHGSATHKNGMFLQNKNWAYMDIRGTTETSTTVAYRGGFGVPPRNFEVFNKAKPNSHFREKYIHNNLITIHP
jgi:hypothetical protein